MRHALVLLKSTAGHAAVGTGLPHRRPGRSSAGRATSISLLPCRGCVSPTLTMTISCPLVALVHLAFDRLGAKPVTLPTTTRSAWPCEAGRRRGDEGQRASPAYSSSASRQAARRPPGIRLRFIEGDSLGCEDAVRDFADKIQQPARKRRPGYCLDDAGGQEGFVRCCKIMRRPMRSCRPICTLDGGRAAMG